MPSKGALAQSAQDVVGTYTVASFVNVQGDKKTEVYGPHPKGQMRLDASGRYMVVLMRPDLPKFTSNNRGTGTARSTGPIALGSFVHLGTYKVADGHIIFRLENATYPNWDGDVQKRRLTVAGDELKYEVSSSNGRDVNRCVETHSLSAEGHLLAQSGHADRRTKCPLFGEERTPSFMSTRPRPATAANRSSRW